MKEKNNTNWFKKHPILTGIIILVVLVIVLRNVSDSKETNNDSNNINDLKDVEKIDPLTKTSNFTLEDCIELCNYYELAAQTSICENSCQMIGKEGPKLDQYCLNLIHIHNR